jgi:hypothetical protein
MDAPIPSASFPSPRLKFSSEDAKRNTPGFMSYRVQNRWILGRSNHSYVVGAGLIRALSLKDGNATSASHASAMAHNPSVMSPLGELSATNLKTKHDVSIELPIRESK